MRARWIVVLMLLLAGCTHGAGGSGTGPVTLRFQSLAWQEESVEANKELVKEWNATHPGIKVDYIQGSWDSVHDQLLTSFEGGEAPDIIHDASDDLADFAYGGYLADLSDLLPKRLKSAIPQHSWDTTTFGDGVYGVPFLQEPRVPAEPDELKVMGEMAAGAVLPVILHDALDVVINLADQHAPRLLVHEAPDPRDNIVHFGSV